jgi:hypothetical protein
MFVIFILLWKKSRKMIKNLIVVLIICELLIIRVLASNPTSIPISHPVYTYLERMEALGYAENLLDGIRLFTNVKVDDVFK